MQALRKHSGRKRAIKASERERGEGHRSRCHECQSDAVRNADAWTQRQFAEAMYRLLDGFGGTPEESEQDRQQTQIDDIAQMQWPRRVLGEQAGQGCTERKSCQIEATRDHRGACAVFSRFELGDPCSECTCTEAGGESVQRPRHTMFAVVFEVHPEAGKKDAYLGLAKHLKPILATIEGFIDNERFESKRRSGWVLSLSTWRDEKSVVRWRGQSEHHKIQQQGREAIFSDYHLRVCEVTADSHPPEGLGVVEQRFDETEIGEAKALTVTEISPGPGATFSSQPELLPGHLEFGTQAEGLIDYDLFESIISPGKMLLASWKNSGSAERWTPKPFAGVVELRHRRLRNIRDYGMFERREAPQYYPNVVDHQSVTRGKTSEGD